MIASSPWLVSVLHRTRLAKRHYYVLKEKSQPLQTPLQNWNGSKMGINSNMHVMWLSTWVYAKQKPCAFWGCWNAVLWNQIWFNVRLCPKQMFCLEKMSSSLFRHAFCISSNCFQGLHKNILDTAKNTQHFDSVHVAEKSLEPSEIGWTGHFLAIKNSSWWFHTLWKIVVEMGIFPNFRGENKESLETTTQETIIKKPPSICGDKAAKCITSGRNARPEFVWQNPKPLRGTMHEDPHELA